MEPNALGCWNNRMIILTMNLLCQAQADILAGPVIDLLSFAFLWMNIEELGITVADRSS